MSAVEPAAPTAPSANGVDIRPLRTHAELAACAALQQEIWGPGFADAVPPSILKVAQRVGGVATGAFDAHGRLLGFVFGLTGVERGRIVHWSDMLAVRPEARDFGLGRRLKAHQRDAARAAGATIMYWTYDPLVARNAHLNLVRLGARVTEYVQDFYGETGSALHRGMSTDRLIVAWPLDTEPAAREWVGEVDGIPVLNADPERGGTASTAPGGDARPPLVRVLIPADIAAVQQRSLEAAAAWRAVTRDAFCWALGGGYRVATFAGRPWDAYGSYILERDAGAGR